MLIKSIVVTPFQQNARIITMPGSSAAAVIDPGGEVGRILSVAQANKLDIQSVILTHAHIDHAGGVKKLLKEVERSGNPRPKLIAHREGEQLRESIAQQSIMFGLPMGEYENVPEPDILVDDGSEIAIGSMVADVLFTPGHAPDHVALFFSPVEFECEWIQPTGESATYSGTAPVLIAGDTLFQGSIGRTDLPGGDYETLMRSIKEKLLELPDSTVVMSGHGPDTFIGDERKSNPFLQMG